MNKDTNKMEISEETTSKLESLERSYNLKLSEFKENLDKEYEKKKYYIYSDSTIFRNIAIPHLILVFSLTP